MLSTMTEPVMLATQQGLALRGLAPAASPQFRVCFFRERSGTYPRTLRLSSDVAGAGSQLAFRCLVKVLTAWMLILMLAPSAGAAPKYRMLHSFSGGADG